MTESSRVRSFVRRWTVRLVWAAILVFATIVVGGGLDARRRLPDLEPWHRIVPRDVRASDLTPRSSLADYLAIEDAAFRTVHDRIELKLDAAARVPANRYNPDGRAYPGRFGTDWNRTQVLAPDGEAIGGALLVHGLTDGPYSMRTIGEDLRARGYHVLALRLPGHGTVPAGLTDVTWEDWLAAVRLGARHVRATIGRDKPLVLVGYSNGGAVALKYVLDAIEGSGDPQAARIVLLSPMIGVAPFAWLARVISMLGPVPAFRKGTLARRLSRIQPVQVQLFCRQRRPADLASHHDVAAADRTDRWCRTRIATATGPHVPLARGRDGEHGGRGPQSVRRHRRRTVGAGALRHQPDIRARPVHPAG